jgi:hypothetical protein
MKPRTSVATVGLFLFFSITAVNGFVLMNPTKLFYQTHIVFSKLRASVVEQPVDSIEVEKASDSTQNNTSAINIANQLLASVDDVKLLQMAETFLIISMIYESIVNEYKIPSKSISHQEVADSRLFNEGYTVGLLNQLELDEAKEKLMVEKDLVSSFILHAEILKMRVLIAESSLIMATNLLQNT